MVFSVRPSQSGVAHGVGDGVGLLLRCQRRSTCGAGQGAGQGNLDADVGGCQEIEGGCELSVVAGRWSDHAAAVYSAADLVENWRECGTTPEDTRHFWRWLDEPNGAPSEYGTRLDAGGDHERADALVVRVLRALPAGGRQSALTVVVEAAGLSEPGDPFRPASRMSLPRSRRQTRSCNTVATMRAATRLGAATQPAGNERRARGSEALPRLACLSYWWPQPQTA